MTCYSIELPGRAARNIVAVGAFLFALGLAQGALAQEEAPPEASEAGAPAEGAAPAEGTAIDPETLEVVPVQPTEAAEAEAAPAAAEATKLDTIEVTGSRIKRTDYETAQPVLVISREDIDRTGITLIGELLQDLPQAGSALNRNFSSFVDVGGVEVDLRNLGSTRVLVLVNGHRWVNGLRSLGTSAVDLTTIPISVIERIEVLKDGASAIYGSDAIAGVINIVLRKDYAGAELRTYGGGFLDYWDGITQSHSLSFGNVAGKTSMFFDLSYTNQEELGSGDREITAKPVFGTGVTRGSGTTPQGHFLFIPEPATASALSAVDPDACSASPALPGLCDITVRTGTTGSTFADFRFHNPFSDPYNFAPEIYLLTPNEQSALFGQIAHQLTDTIGFRTELLYNHRRSQQRAAPMPIITGDLAPANFAFLYVDRTNPFNPLGQNVGKGTGGPLTPGSGAALKRPLEYGPRLFTQEVDTMRGGLSLNGPLDLDPIGISRLLTWEVGYSYAESREKETNEGLFNLTRMGLALGPLTGCETDPELRCVPLDLFGGQTRPMTREMLDYIIYTGVGTTRQVMRDAFANFSTELFTLPAGPLGVAFGIEYREEEYAQLPDPLIVAGNSSSNRAQPTDGAYDVTETFLEFAVPIVQDFGFDNIPGLRDVAWLKGVPIANELDLSIAGRRSEYSAFGKSETGKLGLRWKPIDDLLVRSTLSTAFRAPSVGELFLGNADSFPGLVDPCSSDIRASDPNAEANCSADNVNPTNTQIFAQLLEVFQGNADLKPEEAKTWTAGLVYSPAFVPDLNLYFDWYLVTIDDFITVIGGQGILDSCYLADSPEKRQFCQYVHRDSQSGVIQFVDNPFLNLAQLDTEGFDITADYVLPWFQEFGRFKLVGDSSYLIEYNLFTPGVGGEITEDQYAGRDVGVGGAFPRWKANATLDWALDNWNASYSIRYVHHMIESCNDQVFENAFVPSLRDFGVCSRPDPSVVADDPTTPMVDETDPDDSENELKAVFYHSVQMGYNIPGWNTKVVFGINNLFDQDPPPSYANIQHPAFEFTAHELPGQFGYLRLQKSF